MNSANYVGGGGKWVMLAYALALNTSERFKVKTTRELRHQPLDLRVNLVKETTIYIHHYHPYNTEWLTQGDLRPLPTLRFSCRLRHYMNLWLYSTLIYELVLSVTYTEEKKRQNKIKYYYRRILYIPPD